MDEVLRLPPMEGAEPDLHGLDEEQRDIIDDTLLIDPKTKRIEARCPLIDGWKLDIKYIGYE